MPPKTLARLLGLALLLGGLASGVRASASHQPPGSPDRAVADGSAQEDPAESDDEPADAEGGEQREVAPDAMRDPLITNLIRRRVLIDKPRFSLETGGKIQVQYYDSDPADANSEDELLLRRVRPFLMGRFASSWRWKFELELSSQLTALEFDSNELDVRDSFIRYEGFERDGARLTLGNQKVPFSRDFMNPSTNQLFVERTFVGETKAGVPDRAFGAHLRRPTRSGKLVVWASLGSESHRQDARALRFESPVGASSDLNVGWLAAGRLDVMPAGALRLGKDTHYDFSLAGYHWGNNGSRNPFTSQGATRDPEKPDLDEAQGLEVSGSLYVGGFVLLAQHNRFRAETVAKGFTGGIYVDGETAFETAAVGSGYQIPGSRLQLTAGVTRLDTDSYATAWSEWIAGFNLDLNQKYHSKAQVTHRWISNRFGLPQVDFQETRIQVQYVW